MRCNRETQIKAFLRTAGWEAAQRNPLPGDASSRRYEKLSLNGSRAVLMDAPSGAPSGGYADIAKLADGRMAAFTSICQALTQRGFSAPKIISADLEAGLLLTEDLGDDDVAQVLKDSPELEREIYMAAMDTLGAIYRSSFLRAQPSFGSVWDIRDYDAAAMQAEVDLMAQWYLPYKDVVLSPDQKLRWEEIWAGIFESLTAHAPGLVLRDFHAQNIFWLPQRDATSKIGLIDFQDALMGHPAYDVVSLIEDARRDVGPALTAPLIDQFCAAAKIQNDDSFTAAYAAIGAQRNAKILGIFVRLARRDDKPAYLNLLPRVEAHFQNNLSHPVMADLRAFLKDLS